MDMLEILHVLADHKQVILPLVDHFELPDRLTVTGMENSKKQFCALPRLYDRGYGPELQSIIADIKWRGAHQVHTASWTFARNVLSEIGMHGTHPCCVFLRLRRLDQRQSRGRQRQRYRQE